MRNVKLKKDFRGLKEGTEFSLNPKTGMWAYVSSEEDITDHSVSKSSINVQFSDAYVQSRLDVFEVPSLEDKRIMEKHQKIIDLERLVENTLEEINRLKQE